MTHTGAVFLPLSSGRVNNDCTRTTPAHRRGPKSLLPPRHEENSNVLFRFQYLTCGQSPNSAAQSLVKFSHKSWSSSAPGPATLSGARLRAQPVPAHYRGPLPTHNMVFTFRRGCCEGAAPVMGPQILLTSSPGREVLVPSQTYDL